MALLKIIHLIIILAILATPGWTQERTMSREEILSILKEKCDPTLKDWFESGLMEAVSEEHGLPTIIDPNELEKLIIKRQQDYLNAELKPEKAEYLQQDRYKAIPFNIRYAHCNEYEQTLHETVRRKVNEFIWMRETVRRKDRIQPPDDGNPMYEYYDMKTNKIRSHSWDGKCLVIQYPGVNSAQIHEVAMGVTPVYSGAIKESYIFGGKGILKYEFLVDAEISGIRQADNSVALTIHSPSGVLRLELDGNRNYTPLSYSMEGTRQTVIYQYGDYRQFDGRWVPFSIHREDFLPRNGSLVSIMKRNTVITRLEPLPDDTNFTVTIKDDTLVQYYVGAGARYSYYQSNGRIHTDDLLKQKKQYDSCPIDMPHNCATACLHYLLSYFGQPVQFADLAPLVGPITNETIMYDLALDLIKRDLHYNGVVADLKTMLEFGDCLAVIAFPENHFSILGRCDTDFVRLIDLTRQNFYYKVNRQEFEKVWSSGAVLLVSDKDIVLPDSVVQMTSTQMTRIAGSAGYSCTNRIQDYRIVFCTPPREGDYQGSYRIYHERWGCEPAPSGLCLEDDYPRVSITPCICSSYDPEQCTISGDWDTRFIKACN